MGSNTFGNLFQITTFGESKGPFIGVVIDGCPSNLPISAEEINKELVFRQGGNNYFVTPRKELDRAQIISGVFKGKTTGAPIAILISNKKGKGKSYEKIADLLRPGHANFTYLEKYGIFDFRSGGRASGRETVARVAASAIAKKILKAYKIEILSFLKGVGGITIPHIDLTNFSKLKLNIAKSSIFCPDPKIEKDLLEKLNQIKKEGDSIGGVVGCAIFGTEMGLGEPIFGKVSSRLASAMLSIGGVKGFEIGEGFKAASMRGSEHNDLFGLDGKGKVITLTNYAGGILGGITTGNVIWIQVAFKPTSSIKIPQKTLSLKKEKKLLKWSNFSHDICLAIRGTSVVSAMSALVMVDLLLESRIRSISF